MNPPSDLSDRIEDYDFALPPELIAQDPAPERQAARLLVVRREPERGMPRFEDLRVSDLPELARSEPRLADALWVRNRSRVIPARFYARRATGGRHEIVLTEETSPGVWQAIVRNQAAFKYPQTLHVESEPALTFASPAPGVVDFGSTPVLELLERVGEMPLPPYIRKREAGRDRDRYQPVWSRPDKAASVAAPTASLHFTPEICEALEAAGQGFADIVLHVGLGTFEPLRQSSIAQHTLHSERLEVPQSSVERLRAQVRSGRPVVPIGTTALRTLESLSLLGEPARPESQITASAEGLLGRTHFFVRPGAEIRYANCLFTNFHLPQSTLLVLVATFCRSRVLALEAYNHAVKQGYRFFSFGDASLWL